MSDDATARLGLSYLAAGQMQKHVTLNEALTRLDAVVQTAVVSRSIAEQPEGAADGDLYILPEDAEGAAWSAWPEGALVRRDGAGWRRVEASPGMGAFVLDEGVALVLRDDAWTSLGASLGAIGDLERFGLAAEADGANPFIARLNNALWTARGADDGGTGDLRLTLNKSGTGHVASLVFQSAWSGRAELGLVGDDAFAVKVSPDGSSWIVAMSLDPDSGAASFPGGAGRVEQVVLAADTAWTPPAWARWVAAVCIGGGGGGGSGGAGASGVARSGGGGGGAGSISRAVWPVALLSGSLDVIVGAGGEGGDDGEASLIRLGETPILSAHGGLAGGAGVDGAEAPGGAGGDGPVAGAAGGAGLPADDGAPGETAARVMAPGGGGAGGGLDVADTPFAGGSGGLASRFGLAAEGGAGGEDAAGADGEAALSADLSPPGGGGGGGGASATAGHEGGDGGGFGSGGGGGGAGVASGGSGGAGGPGLVLLTVAG